MNGKDKCRILKDIRRKIAEDNGIEYATSECRHKGNCRGTCPKCEAELKYLEAELEKRRSAGKRVAVAGIAAALMISATGCDGISPTVMQTDGDMEYVAPSSEAESIAGPDSTFELSESESGTEAVETATVGELLPPTETCEISNEIIGEIEYKE